MWTSENRGSYVNGGVKLDQLGGVKLVHFL